MTIHLMIYTGQGYFWQEVDYAPIIVSAHSIIHQLDLIKQEQFSG